MNYFEEIKQDPKLDMYKIIVKEDVNDADYIYVTKKLSSSEFESDELFQLVLCYLNNPYTNVYDWQTSSYGYYFENDINFPWLRKYLFDKELINYISDNEAHSIPEIKIYHYKDGLCNIIKLKDFKTIYNDEEKLIDYVNNLHTNLNTI